LMHARDLHYDTSWSLFKKYICILMLMTMYMNVILFFYVDMMSLYFIIEIVHASPKGKKLQIWCIVSAQNWSLQCPSNGFWDFKKYLKENNPSKHNPHV
jgi:hypothetical protein